MFLVYVLVVSSLASLTSACLSASVYSDPSCGSDIVAQVAVPAGTCINVPPVNQSVPFQSASFTCSMSGTDVLLSIKTYLQASCGGLAIPLSYKVPTACDQGVVVGCTGSPFSTASWPAVAAYADSSCGASPLGAVSMRPDTCDGGSITKKDGTVVTGSVYTTMTDTDVTVNAYTDSACATLDKTETFPTNQCKAGPVGKANPSHLEILQKSFSTVNKVADKKEVPEFTDILTVLTDVQGSGWAGASGSVPNLSC